MSRVSNLNFSQLIVYQVRCASRYVYIYISYNYKYNHNRYVITAFFCFFFVYFIYFKFYFFKYFSFSVYDKSNLAMNLLYVDWFQIYILF